MCHNCYSDSEPDSGENCAPCVPCVACVPCDPFCCSCENKLFVCRENVPKKSDNTDFFARRSKQAADECDDKNETQRKGRKSKPVKDGSKRRSSASQNKAKPKPKQSTKNSTDTSNKVCPDEEEEEQPEPECEDEERVVMQCSCPNEKDEEENQYNAYCMQEEEEEEEGNEEEHLAEEEGEGCECANEPHEECCPCMEEPDGNRKLSASTTEFINCLNESLLLNIESSLKDLLDKSFDCVLQRVNKLNCKLLNTECLLSSIYLDLQDKINKQNAESCKQFSKTFEMLNCIASNVEGLRSEAKAARCSTNGNSSSDDEMSCGSSSNESVSGSKPTDDGMPEDGMDSCDNTTCPFKAKSAGRKSCGEQMPTDNPTPPQKSGRASNKEQPTEASKRNYGNRGESPARESAKGAKDLRPSGCKSQPQMKKDAAAKDASKDAEASDKPASKKETPKETKKPPPADKDAKTKQQAPAQGKKDTAPPVAPATKPTSPANEMYECTCNREAGKRGLNGKSQCDNSSSVSLSQRGIWQTASNIKEIRTELEMLCEKSMQNTKSDNSRKLRETRK